MMQSLIKKKGNLPRRRDEDLFHNIWRHYCDPKTEIVLTEHEKKRIEIYNELYDRYVKGFSRGETVKYVQNKLAEEGNEVTTRHMYKYLQDAVDIFGDLDMIDYAREKRIFIEMGKTLYRMCIDEKDLNAAKGVYSTLAKVMNFEENGNDLADMIRKLKPTTVIISADPESLMRQAEELVEDIEFEEQGDGGDE
jgi:hypothetical protein